MPPRPRYTPLPRWTFHSTSCAATFPQAFVHALLLETAVRLNGPDTGRLPKETL